MKHSTIAIALRKSPSILSILLVLVMNILYILKLLSKAVISKQPMFQLEVMKNTKIIFALAEDSRIHR